jgi:pyridoxal phosphate enzyme (YggS family)
MAGLADNLARVRERLGQAALRSGRAPEAIALVAVTKGQGAETVRGLWELGLRDFGENRVQEAVPKMQLELPQARWHLIGHLQENKINKILPHVHLIQGIDSLAIARAVDVRAQRQARRIPVLLEVKTSPEPSKLGVPVDAAPDVYAALQACSGLEPRGLMTLAPYGVPERDVRTCFAALRTLRERLQAAGCAAGVLSMGMSDDFEAAIEEGSTMVRIGRALVAT